MKTLKELIQQEQERALTELEKHSGYVNLPPLVQIFLRFAVEKTVDEACRNTAKAVREVVEEYVKTNGKLGGFLYDDDTSEKGWYIKESVLEAALKTFLGEELHPDQ